MVSRNITKEATMPFGSTSRHYGALPLMVIVLALASLLYPQTAQATNPILEVRMGNPTGSAGTQVPVDVTIINRTDSVEAFTVWVKLQRPDIANFHYTLVSGVAKGKFDTVGTKTQGFEYLDVRSLGGDGQDMLITGIANAQGGPPAVKPAFPPSSSASTLIRLYLDIKPISDTVTDRTAGIHIDSDFLEKFIFSRPDGTAIGVYQIYQLDTACYQCLQWLNGTCVNKKRVSTPPCDFTELVTDTIPTLDTVLVKSWDGTLTVTAGCCVGVTGNVNMTGIVDSADLAALVSYLTGGGFVPTCTKEANVNATGIVDSADLAALVSYLTGGGFSLPTCP
jgi:hypothetical protein